MLAPVTHEEARVLLRSYAAGELGLDEAAPVRAHLATGCSDCLRDVFNHPLDRPPPPQVASPRGRRSTPARAAGAVLAAAAIAAWGVRQLHVPQAPPVGEPPAAEWTPPPIHQAHRANIPGDLEPMRPTEPSPQPARTPGAVSGGARNDLTSAGRAAPADARPAAPVVRYAQDVVSVRVLDMALAEVLGEIGRQSGAAIRGQVREARRVSADFEDVPLPDALQRLLGDQNFLLVYDAGHRPRMVELLGLPAEALPAVADTAKSQPEPELSSEDALRLLDRHPAVLLKAELKEALGVEAMSLKQLLDTSLNHAEKPVRAEATRTLLAAIKADGELRSALFSALAPMDETALGALVRRMAGDRAQEALFYLATQAWGSGLRNVAVTLLQQLQAEEHGAPAADG